MSIVRVCRLPVVLLLIVSLAGSSRRAFAADPAVLNPLDPDRVVRDVRMGPGGVLEVRAVDANGQPVPNGTIHLRRTLILGALVVAAIAIHVVTSDDDSGS